MASGGVISRFQGKKGEQLGPFRVWFKFGIGPGLAMTRTFGDTFARKIGVISEPGTWIIILINRNCKI